MFDINQDPAGVIHLIGRLDAVSAAVARDFLVGVDESATLDFSLLEYIASAGLGILAATQRRLLDQGGGLRLSGMTPHIHEVLTLAGFQSVFEFEE